MNTRQSRSYKRTLTSALGLVLFVSLLVLGTPIYADDTSDEVIELYYFTWATGANYNYIQEDLIEPFEALHPNIKIHHEAVPGGEFWDKLPVLIASGQAPDLIHMSVGYIFDYARKGLLENLQPYFDRDLNEDDFFMEPFKAVRYPDMETGDLYAVPYSFMVTALFYNKDMFDTAGVYYPDDTWTWDDLRAAARRLTMDKDGDGISDQYGFVINPHYESFDPLVRSFGGRMLSDDLRTVTFNSPEGIAATQFVVDMIQEDRSTIRGSRNEFVNQRVAMWISGMYQIDMRDIVTFNWDVAMMPSGPAGRVVRLWPDSFAIPKDAKHKEAAWEFIKYVITRTEMDRYIGSRKVPVYKELATSPEWLEADKVPDKMVFLRSIPYGDPLEFRPAWGEWEPVRWSALTPAMDGKESVLNAVIKASEAMQAIIDRFWAE